MGKIGKGVGVIITNDERSLFYFQKKDDGYFVEPHRNKYCFFGGGTEEKESDHEALKRELYEELEEKAAKMIIQNFKRLFESSFINILNKPYRFILFESIVETETLKQLANLPVKEGKGKLLSIEEVYKIDFFKDIKHMLLRYLKNTKEGSISLNP